MRTYSRHKNYSICQIKILNSTIVLFIIRVMTTQQNELLHQLAQFAIDDLDHSLAFSALVIVYDDKSDIKTTWIHWLVALRNLLKTAKASLKQTLQEPGEIDIHRVKSCASTIRTVGKLMQNMAAELDRLCAEAKR